MKIVLTCALNYLPSEDSYAPSLPLGILSCAAVLEESGFDVEIVDPNILILEDEVARHNLYENLARHLARREASAYGFSTSSASYHQSLRVADALKRISPDITVVFGGPQASEVDEATVKHFMSVDVVVRGEGELTLSALVNRIRADEPWLDIPGITFRSDGRIIRNIDAPLLENLDELPMPAWHLYPIETLTVIPLDAGRGCPSQSVFSSCCHYWQKQLRFKSNRRLVQELLLLREIMSRGLSSSPAPLSPSGESSLPFTAELPHELFTSDVERLQQFCQLMRAEAPAIRWSCVGRVGVLDEKTLAMMAESGCVSVRYDVESGSSDVQKSIGTNYELIDIGDAITLSLSNGLHVDTAYTVGFPFEREEDVRHTFELMRRTFLKGRERISIHCSLLVPYVGSSLYESFREKLIYNGYKPERREGVPYDRENVRLLVKYPEIFSSHYHIGTKFLRRDVIEEVVELMTVPMTIMPATSLALWQEVHDPFTLHKDWKLYNESPMAKERYRFDYLRGDGHMLFARVFSDFIGHMVRSRFLRTTYLADLAEYELTRFLTGRRPRKHAMLRCPVVGHSPTASDSGRNGRNAVRATGRSEEVSETYVDERLFSLKRPIRESELTIKTFDYDVIEIASAIVRREYDADIEPAKTTVVLWQISPGVVDSMTADDMTLKMLDLCRGKMTVSEIERRFQEKKHRRSSVEEESVRERLRAWCRRGVIWCAEETCGEELH